MAARRPLPYRYHDRYRTARLVRVELLRADVGIPEQEQDRHHLAREAVVHVQASRDGDLIGDRLLLVAGRRLATPTVRRPGTAPVRLGIDPS